MVSKSKWQAFLECQYSSVAVCMLVVNVCQLSEFVMVFSDSVLSVGF